MLSSLKMEGHKMDDALTQFVLDKSNQFCLDRQYLREELTLLHTNRSGNSSPTDSMSSSEVNVSPTYFSESSIHPQHRYSSSISAPVSYHCQHSHGNTSPVMSDPGLQPTYEGQPSVFEGTYKTQILSSDIQTLHENNVYMDLNGNYSDLPDKSTDNTLTDYPPQNQMLVDSLQREEDYGYHFTMSTYTDEINEVYGQASSNSYHTCYPPQDSYNSDESFEVPSPCAENLNTSFGSGHFPSSQPKMYERTSPHTFYQERRGLPHFSVFAETKKTTSRRGRPVTFNKPGYHFSDSDGHPSDEDERLSVQQKGARRGAKNILLWKFLLGELRKPNSQHIKWEDERSGIFKFVDTAECSRLWGLMKKKEDMNFEKLSRGIRHYYKDGLMSRRDGIRLVYKFNWERVPRAYWPRNSSR